MGGHSVEEIEVRVNQEAAARKILELVDKAHSKVVADDLHKETLEMVLKCRSLPPAYIQLFCAQTGIEVSQVNSELVSENYELRAEVVALQQKLSAMEKAILLAENKPSEKKFDI